MRRVLFCLFSLGTAVCGCGSDEQGPTQPIPAAESGSDSSAEGSVLEAGDGSTEGVAEGSEAAPPGLAPWIVFTQAGASAPMSDNKLANPDCETQEGAALASWKGYESGYQVGLGEGRTGNALKLIRTQGDTASYGAYQSLPLNQAIARPVYFSAWSKAQDLTGDPDSASSVYLDIAYKTTADDPVNGCAQSADNPCALYGQIPNPRFEVGTHDWQQREGFAVPAYPIKSLNFYVLLRGSHSGTVLYDDLVLKEVDSAIMTFDGNLVSTQKPGVPYSGGTELAIATTDGLELSLWSQGGVGRSLKIDGTDLFYSEFDYGSGFFVHEAEASEWWALGGYAEKQGKDLVQKAEGTALGLQLSATWSAEADRLRVRAEISSTQAQDRALTVYYALPVQSQGWYWGDDLRRFREIGQVQEFSNLTRFWGTGDLGATGEFSRFPFATVYSTDRGLALGYPLDQPRIARLVHNPVTRQLYIAFDVGLSQEATKMPSRAAVELLVYRTRPNLAPTGFRHALQGFYDRFPDHFARRIPAEKEGIWVAFADLSEVQNGPGESIEDFNVGFHELGSLAQAAFDDQHGIQSFRYILEPASTWLQIDDSAVDVNNKDQVVAFLQQRYQAGTEAQKKVAEKTLSSGVFDREGTLAYDPYEDGPPWCSGKCALFYLSADPDISEPPYTINQATYHWNAQAQQAYTTTPGLDGEYIDSFVMQAKRPDFRKSHQAAADIPLTFTLEKPRAVVTPMIFSTLEFTRWLRPQLPSDKHLIANGLLIGVPWGADLFDFGGQEIDWVKEVSGNYEIVPEDDWLLSYRRALSGQRPYGFLLNTDFSHVSNEMVERYFRLCLFYGLYPSMFSENASEGNYFATEALYNRDRALFKKYIPLIRSINAGGWRPVTHANSSEDQVFLERFGEWPSSLYLTLRNTSTQALTVTVEVDRSGLGLSGAATLKSLVLGSADSTLEASSNSFELALPAGEIEALRIGP